MLVSIDLEWSQFNDFPSNSLEFVINLLNVNYQQPIVNKRGQWDDRYTYNEINKIKNQRRGEKTFFFSILFIVYDLRFTTLKKSILNLTKDEDLI